MPYYTDPNDPMSAAREGEFDTGAAYGNPNLLRAGARIRALREGREQPLLRGAESFGAGLLGGPGEGLAYGMGQGARYLPGTRNVAQMSNMLRAGLGLGLAGAGGLSMYPMLERGREIKRTRERRESEAEREDKPEKKDDETKGY